MLYGNDHIAIGHELIKLSTIQLSLGDPSAADTINRLGLIFLRYYGSHADFIFPYLQTLKREANNLTQAGRVTWSLHFFHICKCWREACDYSRTNSICYGVSSWSSRELHFSLSASISALQMFKLSLLSANLFRSFWLETLTNICAQVVQWVDGVTGELCLIDWYFYHANLSSVVCVFIGRIKRG